MDGGVWVCKRDVLDTDGVFSGKLGFFNEEWRENLSFSDS